MFKSIIISTLILLFPVVSYSEEPFRTFIITIPKSGTHLLGPAIQHILGKNLFNVGLVIVHPRDEQNPFVNLENKQVIVLVRDPRDVVVSMYYWIKRTHEEGIEWPVGYRELIENNIDMEEALSYIINPDEYGISVLSYFNNAQLWINQDALVVKYEDLIGEKGGGSKEAQLMVLKSISDYLKQELDDEELEEIANAIYGNSLTFRQGKMGDWKNHFTRLC